MEPLNLWVRGDLPTVFKTRFEEVEVEQVDSMIRVRKGNRMTLVPIPAKIVGEIKCRVVRRRVVLRDFESQFSCLCEDGFERLSEKEIMEMDVPTDKGMYKVFIIRAYGFYHIFCGWDWFDGDKYGFIWVDAL